MQQTVIVILSSSIIGSLVAGCNLTILTDDLPFGKGGPNLRIMVEKLQKYGIRKGTIA
jgi:hypothetical protein